MGHGKVAKKGSCVYLKGILEAKGLFKKQNNIADSVLQKMEEILLLTLDKMEKRLLLILLYKTIAD